MLKTLMALEVPAANPKKTTGEEAAKAEDDTANGGSVSNAED